MRVIHHVKPVTHRLTIEIEGGEITHLQDILHRNKDWINLDAKNFEYSLWKAIKDETNIAGMP